VTVWHFTVDSHHLSSRYVGNRIATQHVPLCGTSKLIYYTPPSSVFTQKMNYVSTRELSRVFPLAVNSPGVGRAQTHCRRSVY